MYEYKSAIFNICCNVNENLRDFSNTLYKLHLKVFDHLCGTNVLCNFIITLVYQEYIKFAYETHWTKALRTNEDDNYGLVLKFLSANERNAEMLRDPSRNQISIQNIHKYFSHIPTFN